LTGIGKCGRMDTKKGSIMKRICPDCGKIFEINLEDIFRLDESFRMNPTVKWVCPKCGIKIEIYCELKKIERIRRWKMGLK
jgi:hypothetical protein